MFSKKVMGGGAIFLGIVMLAAMFLDLPSSLNYVWAIIVIIWGVMVMIGK